MSEPTDPSFTLRRAFKPETVDEHAVDQMIAVLDAQDRQPSIERLRAWALAAAGVRPGDSCLDVGSGTGTMTRRLAALAGPTGRALGIEPNGMLRGVAVERTAAAGSQATFCQGLATELPLPDASVDLVWCERVLQHLPDAQAAIVEFARVLRPGGRAVLLDSDHESRVESGMEPEVARALKYAFMDQVANPTAARHIPRQAKMAGLEVDADVGSSAVVFPREMLLNSPLLRLTAEQAVADGALTRAQADAALAAQRAAAEEGWAFSAVTVFGFICRKR